jgi:hypothetical protein
MTPRRVAPVTALKLPCRFPPNTVAQRPVWGYSRAMTKTFRTDRERELYRVLHDQGETAFEQAAGVWAIDLLNRWNDAHLIRQTFIATGPGAGSYATKTFKRYAA